MSNDTPGTHQRRRDRVYAEALELSAEERAELACSLMESLEADDDGTASPAQWARSWATEVAKRLAAMDAGMPGIPAADAIAALRRHG